MIAIDLHERLDMALNEHRGVRKTVSRPKTESQFGPVQPSPTRWSPRSLSAKGANVVVEAPIDTEKMLSHCSFAEKICT